MSNELKVTNRTIEELDVKATPVTSVNGKAGAVQLNQDDIPDGETYIRYSKAKDDELSNLDDKIGVGCAMWHTEYWFNVPIGSEVNIESYELIEYEERHESRTPQVGDIVWDANSDVYEITVVEPSGTLSIALRIPIDRLARDFQNLERDVGDIETALDRIIEIQESLIGGNV